MRFWWIAFVSVSGLCVVVVSFPESAALDEGGVGGLMSELDVDVGVDRRVADEGESGIDESSKLLVGPALNWSRTLTSIQ